MLDLTASVPRTARKKQSHGLTSTSTELAFLVPCFQPLFSPQPGSLEAELATAGLNAPLSTLEYEEALRDQASKAVEHRQHGGHAFGSLGALVHAGLHTSGPCRGDLCTSCAGGTHQPDPPHPHCLTSLAYVCC